MWLHKRKMRWREKSVWKSLSEIIYWATLLVSQWAHVSTWRVVSQMRSWEYLNSCMCSHVLFGTRAEWPSILSRSETSEHSFLLSSLISSLRHLLHHLAFRQLVLISILDQKQWRLPVTHEKWGSMHWSTSSMWGSVSSTVSGVVELSRQ